jgi:hypothetical protein
MVNHAIDPVYDSSDQRAGTHTAPVVSLCQLSQGFLSHQVLQVSLRQTSTSDSAGRTSTTAYVKMRAVCSFIPTRISHPFPSHQISTLFQNRYAPLYLSLTRPFDPPISRIRPLSKQPLTVPSCTRPIGSKALYCGAVGYPPSSAEYIHR